MPSAWSPLAIRAPHPRDVRNRARPLGILVHSTGSGIVDSARRAKVDPLEMATSFYTNKNNNFAHYLIGHKGEIVQIAADTEKAWQAAWAPWEKQAYKDGTWTKKWARDYADKVVAVPENFYAKWAILWTATRGFRSPIDLIKAVAGDALAPNEAFVGIELLDSKPFTSAQYDSLAKLVIDLSMRWSIPFNVLDLPDPYLCGHEDVCPGRRYKKQHNNTGNGVGWDPGEQFSWSTLKGRIMTWAATDLSRWYPQ